MVLLHDLDGGGIWNSGVLGDFNPAKLIRDRKQRARLDSLLFAILKNVELVSIWCINTQARISWRFRACLSLLVKRLSYRSVLQRFNADTLKEVELIRNIFMRAERRVPRSIRSIASIMLPYRLECDHDDTGPTPRHSAVGIIADLGCPKVAQATR